MESNIKLTVDSPINQAADAVSSAITPEEVEATIRKLELLKSLDPELQQVILARFTDITPEHRAKVLVDSLEKISKNGHRRRIIGGWAGVGSGTTFASGGAYMAVTVTTAKAAAVQTAINTVVSAGAATQITAATTAAAAGFVAPVVIAGGLVVGGFVLVAFGLKAFFGKAPSGDEAEKLAGAIRGGFAKGSK